MPTLIQFNKYSYVPPPAELYFSPSELMTIGFA